MSILLMIGRTMSILLMIGRNMSILLMISVVADIEGNARPVDILSQGVEGTREEYDIGAYEIRTILIIFETRAGRWILYR